MAKKEGKTKKEKVDENEESKRMIVILCIRVVCEDNMGDKEEKDKYSHAISHHSQEPAGPSEGQGGTKGGSI